MKGERIWSLIILCTLVVLVQFGIAILVIDYFEDWPTRGQFGDLFGVVNALFSGLAFAVLIYTMNLQRRELALQREELRLQRQEMADSRAELAKQAEAQLGQRCKSP